MSTPNGTTSQALVAADLAHVLWAVNLACLGFHVWPNRADDPDHADELRIDLDPSPGVDFEMVREAAHEVDDLLPRRRPHRLAQDHRQPGHPRVRPAAGPVVLDRGAGRRRGRGPRAGAAPARPDHGGVVEGGAGPAGVRRLQPERPAQDGVRGLVGAGPARGPGVDAFRLGRAAPHPPRRADHGRLFPNGWLPAGRPLGRRRCPSRSNRCWRCPGGTPPPACSTPPGPPSTRRCRANRRGWPRAGPKKTS